MILDCRIPPGNCKSRRTEICNTWLQGIVRGQRSELESADDGIGEGHHIWEGGNVEVQSEWAQGDRGPKPGEICTIQCRISTLFFFQ